MSENAQIVQIRMWPNTLEQIDRIKTIVHAPGRSEAVRRAIGVTDMVINAIIKGDRVLLESQDGKQRQILVTGLNL